ncbi:MAG TPA: MmgE/PrpD family protein [Dehalococcoidia bacterium]|nr:MmgE/PrpD family protein [Dehalococcoidia bacterium]
MTDSLSRRLARFVASMDYESLPPGVVDKMKASLVHGLVMAFIGRANHHCEATIELTLKEEARPDGATILTHGGRATRYGAAFANSSLLHAQNQSDTYRMLAHPGACVIPAVLATAELDGASGRDVLTGMAAGYEVECRMAGDFLPSTQARGFRSSPVYGTFGAAVGAGKTRKLNESGMHSGIGWASTFAAGLGEGSHAFHEPIAARNGVLASYVAGDEFPGSERSLDGPSGFYNAFTGNNEGRLSYTFYGKRQVELADVAADLGDRWELMHIIPKMPPTPGFNIPIIELLKDLKREHKFEGKDIESIQIFMNWLETSYPSPAYAIAEPGKPPRAGGSNYVAAYVCYNGDFPVMGVANQTSSEDQGVRDLMNRVEVLGVWDRVPFAPRISLSMRDGSTIQGEYKGNELEWDFATELKNLRPVFDLIEWPRDRLEGIVEGVSNLEKASSIKPLLALCVP